jgi:hypothetical protein
MAGNLMRFKTQFGNEYPKGKQTEKFDYFLLILNSYYNND